MRFITDYGNSINPWGIDAEKDTLAYTMYRLGQKKDDDKSYEIKKVIFNEPATIIFWTDGTKTVAKCEPEDTFNKEMGFAIAYLKKVLGNSKLHKLMAKYIWDEPKYEKPKQKKPRWEDIFDDIEILVYKKSDKENR